MSNAQSPGTLLSETLEEDRSAALPRTVFVGIAPARLGDEGQPLSALASQSTGRKIADMLGMQPIEYMRLFDRINVCPFPQPSTIQPKEWTSAAENLAGSILRGRRVIMLGQNVAECFGVPRGAYDYCEWKICTSSFRGIAGFRAGRMSLPFSWAVLPHPSGRNRWYNEHENRERAIDFLWDEKKRNGYE